MRKIVWAVIAFCSLSTAVLADEYVRGYTKRDGTYVEPHYRSEPNAYRYDNYSSRGNTNPYTGERGSQRNEYTTPPAYNQGYGSGDQNSERSNHRR